MNAPELSELLSSDDRLAIRSLMHRYAVAFDRRDEALVRSCFVPEPVLTYSGHRFKDSINGLLDLMNGAGNFTSTMHNVGSIHITGVGSAVQVTSYSIAYLVVRDGDSGQHVLHTRGVRYEDVVHRLDGAWRIAERKHAVDWATVSPTEVSPPLPAEFGL